MTVGVVLTTEIAVGTMVGGIVITGEVGRTILVGIKLTCGSGVDVACDSCVAVGVGFGVAVGVGFGVAVGVGFGVAFGFGFGVAFGFGFGVAFESTTVEPSVSELIA